MTTNIFIIHPPDDWSESFDRQLVSAVLSCQYNIAGTLEDLVTSGQRFGYSITTWTFLSKFGDIMSRKSKSNGTTSNNGNDNRGGKGGDAKWVWVNCRLSDEDIAELERSTAEMDYLATCLIALGNDGFGVSIKTVDEGKSKCVTINRPDFPNRGTTVGVSAFGDNLRDAIVTVLYKLDTYGGGDFTEFDVENPSSGSKPRFR